MKKYIISISIVFAAAFGFYACNEEDYSKREFYEYPVYLLSKEDHNVYNVMHPFYPEGFETAGYFSIGVGGSLPNPDAFTVELEQNKTLFNQYNRYVFDIDTGRYAKLLPAKRYHIDQMTVDFPKNNKKQYVKVRVHVDTHGLSPDSIYFIPVSIKSITGGYEANPKKADMLYRVIVANYYAEQIRLSTYTDRGKKLMVNNPNLADVNDIVVVHDSVGQVAETKVMKPLSYNSVRIMCGEEKEAKLGNPTKAELTKGAMILTMDYDYTEGETFSKEVTGLDGETVIVNGEYTPYKKVVISSYGNVEVEQFNDGGKVPFDLPRWNIYREERANQVDNTVIKYFYLQYRYRTRIVDNFYTDWMYVRSTVRKLD